jgi:hypothetical protein
MTYKHDINSAKLEFKMIYKTDDSVKIDGERFTARCVLDDPWLLRKWYIQKHEKTLSIPTALHNDVDNSCFMYHHSNTVITDYIDTPTPSMHTHQYYNQETKEMTDDERMINDALKFAEFDGNTLSVVKCEYSNGGTYSYLYFGDDIAEYRNCKKAVVENQNRNGFCVVNVKSFERFEDTAQRIKDGYYKFIVAFIDETVGENQREAVLTEIADMEQAMFDIRRKEFNKKVAELNEVNAANDEGETE